MAGWELLNDSRVPFRRYNTFGHHRKNLSQVTNHVQSRIIVVVQFAAVCFNMLLFSGTYQEESIQTLNQPTHPIPLYTIFLHACLQIWMSFFKAG
jgi:hypothetical protein